MWKKDNYKSLYNKLFVDSNTKLITFNDMLVNPINKTIHFPEGITSTRIEHPDKDKMLLYVTMPKHSIIFKHYHDCQEICTVFKGKIFDRDSNIVTEQLKSFRKGIRFLNKNSSGRNNVYKKK